MQSEEAFKEQKLVATVGIMINIRIARRNGMTNDVTVDISCVSLV